MHFPLQATVDHAIAKHESKPYPEIVTPIAIICVIIGVVGNMCFSFFFGNNSTRIYRTRDALYFRRMSFFDMLVCVIVLPYSVFYELWFVHNRTVCRIMAFIQHVIIYTSHLTLAAYSFELPRRVSYATVQVNVNRMMKCNLVLALVFSMPAIFLFDIIEVIDEKDERTLTTCKLVVKFQHEEDEHGPISLLRVHYYAVICLCYAMSLVLFIFKIMHYCERVTVLGRRSGGVQLTERTQLRQLKTLENNTWRHRIRRHSQTGRPIIFAEYSEHGLDGTHAEPALEGNSETQGGVSPSCNEQPSIEEDINIPYESSTTQDNGVEITESSTDAEYQRQRKDSLLLNVQRLKSDLDSSTSLQLVNSSSQRLPQSSGDSSITSKSSSSSRNKPTVLFLKGLRRATTTGLGRIFDWPFSKTDTKKSNLKQRSSIANLKMESYKQQIIYLILLDFMCILTGIASFLIMDEHGVTIHLIHTKCFISFYLISIAHPDLRRVVGNNIVYYCLKTFQTKDKEHFRSEES